MKSIINFSLAAALTIFLLSCSKTGDVGPAGATGPGGPAGPAGPAGPVGNANVKVDTFTLATNQWVNAAIYYVGTSALVSTGYVSKYYDRAVPRLTAEFMQAGLVLIYFSSQPDLNTAVYSPMPFSFTNGFGGYALNLAYEATVGKLRLHFFLNKVYDDPPSISTYNVPKYRFKVITIEGSISGRVGTPPDPKDYKAVCKYYGIEE